MRSRTHIGIATLLILTAGCGLDTPTDPTYFSHVQDILRANCSQCHGADPFVPSIAGVRLDRYVRDDDRTTDAFDYADNIIVLAVDFDPSLQLPPMPLDYRLTERQRDILRTWVANGAPKGTRDNQRPEAVAVDPVDGVVTVDQDLSLSFRSWDADGDGLVTAIGVRPQGSGDGMVMASDLGGGLRHVDLDMGTFASNERFEVYAVLDDGYSDDPAENQHEVVLLGDVLVDHGERGTAPTVLLTAPNAGAFFGDIPISWVASDPDPGDVLTIDLDLLRVATDGTKTLVERLASGLDNISSYTWDSTGTPAKDGNTTIRYAIRVTATDAGTMNSRSDDSDSTFTLLEEMAATTLGWADVESFFVTYCAKCHGVPPLTPKLGYFRLDRYDAAAAGNGVLGVYDVRFDVYDKLLSGSMPPNKEPQPPTSEVADVTKWLSAGAPFSGGSDGPPTFSWITPNDNAISATATGDITLSWVAADPEGLPLLGTVAFTKINAVADQQATCDVNLPGWTDIAGIDIEAGSFAWTAPEEGYFCLRAQVTDDAGQTPPPTVAYRPVKYSTNPGPP